MRQLQAVDTNEELRVASGRRGAKREDLVELLQLREPDGGLEIREAVVEADPHVVEPPALVGAALVAQRAEQLRLVLRVGRHDAALAGGDLLVRVEAEDGR